MHILLRMYTHPIYQASVKDMEGRLKVSEEASAAAVGELQQTKTERDTAREEAAALSRALAELTRSTEDEIAKLKADIHRLEEEAAGAVLSLNNAYKDIEENKNEIVRLEKALAKEKEKRKKENEEAQKKLWTLEVQVGDLTGQKDVS